MTDEGALSTQRAMMMAYPNYHPSDIAGTAAFWSDQLRDYKDAEVAIALRAYILSDTSGFAPSIGQIVALIPRNQDGMSELEAWGMVRKAIRNGNYGAEEEFAKLPDNVRAAVGSPGQIRQWAAVDMDDLETVAQSNFLRSYRAVVARERMAGKLPEKLRRLYHREAPAAPQLESREEAAIDGVPMPDEYRRRFGLPAIGGQA